MRGISGESRISGRKKRDALYPLKMNDINKINIISQRFVANKI